MASLSDIYSTFKNLVTVVSGMNRQIQTSVTITGQTLVVTGPGTLVNFCVTVAGSAAGTINNAPSTGTTAASNVLVATPNTVGITQVGVAFNRGLVVSPGTGQSVNVTYSLGVVNATGAGS